MALCSLTSSVVEGIVPSRLIVTTVDRRSLDCRFDGIGKWVSGWRRIERSLKGRPAPGWFVHRHPPEEETADEEEAKKGGATAQSPLNGRRQGSSGGGLNSKSATHFIDSAALGQTRPRTL